MPRGMRWRYGLLNRMTSSYSYRGVVALIEDTAMMLKNDWPFVGTVLWGGSRAEYMTLWVFSPGV